MKKVLVIGGTNIDFICKSSQPLVLKDSNIGKNLMTYGGVGRNICENLGHLGVDVSFISSVGNDVFGSLIINELHSLGIDTEHVITNGVRTGSYISILGDNNDMHVAICDNEAVNELDISYLQKNMEFINSFEYVAIDSNVSDEALEFLLNNVQGQIFIDATSSSKAVKLRPFLKKISFLKCNNLEANAIMGTQDLKSHELLLKFIKLGINQVVITSGTEPICYNKESRVFTADVIKVEQKDIKSTTGCGDAFMSGMIYGMINNMTIHACVKVAKQIAAQTLLVTQACNPNLRV